MIQTHYIKNIKGHYEVFDEFGKVIVSGDTHTEAEDAYEELLIHIKEQYRQNRVI